MSRFLIYDVFADAPFGGNPLAVVLDAQGLPEDRLQPIAREFNFSETTFVYPPADPSHTARVRIFSPTGELPFAGHPTVGTAVALAGLGYQADMTLELGVGPIPVTVDGDTARFSTDTRLTRRATPDPAEVARCLGLAKDKIRTDRHMPEMADVGLSFCIVELASEDALAAASPDPAAFREIGDRYRDRTDFEIFCYARQDGGIRARMFTPLGGPPEDPATGSASAALTALLATHEGRTLELTIRQGVEMGRPSLIRTRAEIRDGRLAGTTVSGSAVKVAEGRLTLSSDARSA